jgi:hypothetical protein
VERRVRSTPGGLGACAGRVCTGESGLVDRCVRSLLNRARKAGDHWDHTAEVESRGHVDCIAGLDAGWAASGRSDLHVWSARVGLPIERNSFISMEPL